MRPDFIILLYSGRRRVSFLHNLTAYARRLIKYYITIELNINIRRGQ